MTIIGRIALFAGVALVVPVVTAAGQTLERGAAVFAAQKCSLCHALDGKGNAKGPLDAIGSKLKAEEIRSWIVTPAEMTAKVKAERKPAMKAFPKLAKDELDALVAFLAAKKK